MSRRGRAVGFLLGALLAAAAAAAIADGYGRSVVRGYGELRPVLIASRSLRAGEEIAPARSRRAARGAAGPRPFRPAGGPGGAAGSARPDPDRGDPGGLLPAGRASAPAAACADAASEPRPRAAAGGDRVSGAGALAPSAGSRSARGLTSSSPANRPARAMAAPTSPPPRSRCWRSAPRGGRNGGGHRHPRADPLAGAAPDRRRELCPPRDRDPGSLMGRRESDVAELAASLRERLVERRRADAAAGRAAGRGRRRLGARHRRRPGGGPPGRRPRAGGRADRPRQRRPRAARGAARRSRRGGGDGQRPRLHICRATRPPRADRRRLRERGGVAQRDRAGPGAARAAGSTS